VCWVVVVVGRKNGLHDFLVSSFAIFLEGGPIRDRPCRSPNKQANKQTNKRTRVGHVDVKGEDGDDVDDVQPVAIF
jgi:hypothetical protein